MPNNEPQTASIWKQVSMMKLAAVTMFETFPDVIRPTAWSMLPKDIPR